eukprot:s1629_g10.t1
MNGKKQGQVMMKRRRPGGAERDGRRSRASAYGERSSTNFQTPPSSWQSIPRRPTGIVRSQGTIPPSAESEVCEGGEGETMEYKAQDSVREVGTIEGNLRDTRKVNFRDTAMGSKGPDGNVQDSNQRKDTIKRKTMGDTLETALGEQMYQEAVLEKEKLASREMSFFMPRSNDCVQQQAQPQPPSSWVEIDKAPSTPKRGTSAAPKHTPGGTQIPSGPRPEGDGSS